MTDRTDQTTDAASEREAQRIARVERFAMGPHTTPEECSDILAVTQLARNRLAAERTRPASAAGDMVLVPREPTEAMLEACVSTTESHARAVWSAMLSAAPAASAPAGDGEAVADAWREAVAIADEFAIEAKGLEEKSRAAARLDGSTAGREVELEYAVAHARRAGIAGSIGQALRKAGEQALAALQPPTTAKVDAAGEVSDWDQKAIRAIGDGAGTWMVAARLNIPTSDARARLCRMEREGKVHRSPRSSINNIIWLVGPSA